MKKIFFLIFFIFSTTLFAEENKTNFTIESFKKAQQKGKIVVVHSWNKFCKTCSKQKPVLKEAEKDFNNVLFLNFEQTKEKDIADFLNISYWTTIVIFKDNKEIIRTIGLSEKDEIYSLIKENI